MVLRCDAGEGGSALEVRFEVLQKVTMNISVFYDVHACSWWGASGCNTPPTNLDTPTKKLQNIKGKHADRPKKTCNSHFHPCVACCFWAAIVGYNVFSKIYVRCFVQCYRTQYVISP